MSAVSSWLMSLHLGQYESLLVSHGYDSLLKCASLTDSELDRIGITLDGHKKRILRHLSRIGEDSAVLNNESESYKLGEAEFVFCLKLGLSLIILKYQ